MSLNCRRLESTSWRARSSSARSFRSSSVRVVSSLPGATTRSSEPGRVFARLGERLPPPPRPAVPVPPAPPRPAARRPPSPRRWRRPRSHCRRPRLRRRASADAPARRSFWRRTSSIAEDLSSTPMRSEVGIVEHRPRAQRVDVLDGERVRVEREHREHHALHAGAFRPEAARERPQGVHRANRPVGAEEFAPASRRARWCTRGSPVPRTTRLRSAGRRKGASTGSRPAIMTWAGSSPSGDQLELE